MTTKEIEQIIMERMYQVWAYIGSDALQMVSEEGDKTYLTKDEVIELVTDAGRTERELEGEVLEYFQKLPYEKVVKLAKKAFPHARYS